MKNLLDEVFNSGKYNWVTIYLNGSMFYRCLAGRDEVTINDTYCVIKQDVQEPHELFKGKPRKFHPEVVFIPYSKIVEVEALPKKDRP